MSYCTYPETDTVTSWTQPKSVEINAQTETISTKATPLAPDGFFSEVKIGTHIGGGVDTLWKQAVPPLVVPKL